MNEWEQLVVDASMTLRAVMETIDKTGLQTALVNSDNGNFIGTLTDGDIRRAILAGAKLSDTIDPYINRKPVTISNINATQVARDAMDRLAIRCVPIISNGRIIGLFSENRSSTVKKIENPVLIMAGGRGERLKPLTNNTPKPLLKVGGKSLLEILLERLAKYGFSNIWISVHYLSEQIEELIGSGQQFGLSVNYIKEHVPLGTAGAYLNLPSENRNLPTIIVNADLVTNVNFQALLNAHMESKALVTIGVIEHLIEIPFGVVEEKNGRVISIVEKPTYSNLVYAGVGVYEQAAFDGFEKGLPFNATDVYEKLLEKDRSISIFEISGYWRDIGTGESLKGAHHDLGISK